MTLAFPEVSLGEARKIVSTIVRFGGEALRGPVEQVRRTALEAVRARGSVPSRGVLAERKSLVDPFVKYLLATHDGERIEHPNIIEAFNKGVRIEPDGKVTLHLDRKSVV